MKKILILLIFAGFLHANGQDVSGIASYKSFVKTDISLDSTSFSVEMRERIEKIIQYHTHKEYELFFNRKESFFHEKEQLQNLHPSMGQVTIIRTGGVGKYYVNRDENFYINQTEILGKEFLIRDSIAQQDWKLGKESKYIGEYLCFKATKTELARSGSDGEMEETEITAWYTPQIPIASGPMNYGALPGF